VIQFYTIEIQSIGSISDSIFELGGLVSPQLPIVFQSGSVCVCIKFNTIEVQLIETISGQKFELGAGWGDEKLF